MNKLKLKNYRILSGVIALLVIASATTTTLVMSNNRSSHISAETSITGDINGDGNVDMSDAILLKKHILGIDALSEQNLAVADLNADGRINALDFSKMLKTILQTENITYINFNGNSISVTGSGAEVNGSIVTVSAAGTYFVSGTLDDGQIIVSAADTDKVTLNFNNVNISCSYNAPVYVENADKTIINLTGENSITDAASYTTTEEGIDSAVYSKDDLTISGTGSLDITANYMYAVNCKNDLKIKGGSIDITSADDAVRGKDSVEIKNGTLTVDSGGDGVKSTQGNVEISGGTLNIKASNDAIQAETTIDISDGDITACGDKGLTGVTGVNITGGNVLATATDNQVSGVTSSQGTMLMTYAAEWSKGNTISVLDNNTEIFSATPIKKFTYVLLSSPDLNASGSYTVKTADAKMLHSTSSTGVFAMNNTITEFTGVVAMDGEIVSTDSTITFNSSNATVTGDGVSASGSTATITMPGTYQVYGNSESAEIIVNVDKTVYSNSETDKVTLVLNGVNLSNSNTAPVNVVSIEDKCVIELADGTTNYITDGSTRTDTSIEAAIYSMDDLQIKGSGTLIVDANYADGIVSKDDLKIKNGNIQVTSVDDAIRGKDSVVVEDGMITIDAEGDGIKASNDEEDGEGYIEISGGSFTINSHLDGIQAESSVNITGGDFNIYTYEGSAYSGTGSTGGNTGGFPGGGGGMGEGNSSKIDDSAKGIKAATDITISDGTFIIDSTDDSIHSNGTVNIKGGEFTIATADDGMHSDSTVTIDGGDITVTKSYEAIEGTSIFVNAGTMNVTASDDGFNVNGGNDGSGMGGSGWFGQDTSTADSTDSQLTFNGGTIFVDATGDGLDSNGTLNFNGGLVYVNGPTSDNNGPVDADRNITSTGGTIIAVGSSGMAMGPNSSASTQASILVSTSVTAGTIVNISDSSGKTIATFAPKRTIASIMITSPNLSAGSTYTISTGGTYTGGTNSNGYYTGGTYSGGKTSTTATASLTVSNNGGGGGRW